MTTLLSTNSSASVLFGGKAYSMEEIATLIETLLLANTSPGGISDHEAMTTLREVEDMFTDDPWSHIYSLWHWKGGKAAQVADLTALYNWLRCKMLDDLAYTISPDYNVYLKALKNIGRANNKAAHGTIESSIVADLLADFLDSLITTASEYVGFDEATNTWSDPNGILPLVDTWLTISEQLRGGLDEEGHYLPDELMYEVLVAAAPQLQEVA